MSDEPTHKLVNGELVPLTQGEIDAINAELAQQAANEGKMDAGTLHEAISEVCPIITVQVGDPQDRATWSYEPTVDATPAQIAAADNVIATIPVDVLGKCSTSEFIGRFTNAEYRAATTGTWRATAGNAKNWDVVIAEDVINMNKKKVTTLKTDLVTAGILTQVRADEIFK